MNRDASDERVLSPLSLALLLVIVSIFVLLGSKFVPHILSYYESDNAFTGLREDAITDNGSAGTGLKPDAGDSESGVKTVNYAKDDNTINWDKFAGQEVVAWIVMDDISYPVMQGGDNSFYLKHLPDGSYNYGGSIFMFSQNNPLLTDQNTIIYGHNMGNGSMFGKLKHYTDNKYKDHNFYVYLPDGTRHTYQFYSVATVYSDSMAYTWSFSGDESFAKWQSWMRDQSFIGTSLKPSMDDRFVTLSTCNGTSGTNHRLIVCGMEISVDKVQKEASWYKDYKEKYDAKQVSAKKRAASIFNGLEEYLFKARQDQLASYSL